MTSHFINYATSETVAILNCNQYTFDKMILRGFMEVSEDIWEEYSHN